LRKKSSGEGAEPKRGKGAGQRGEGRRGMALSTALQNYPAKFLLAEHKTTASGCWPTPNL